MSSSCSSSLRGFGLNSVKLSPWPFLISMFKYSSTSKLIYLLWWSPNLGLFISFVLIVISTFIFSWIICISCNARSPSFCYDCNCSEFKTTELLFDWRVLLDNFFWRLPSRFSISVEFKWFSNFFALLCWLMTFLIYSVSLSTLTVFFLVSAILWRIYLANIFF